MDLSNHDRALFACVHEVIQSVRRNSYRVLLTRASQGIILYIPRGDPADPTRSPQEFDETANFLIFCGVKPLSPGMTAAKPELTLFQLII